MQLLCGGGAQQQTLHRLMFQRPRNRQLSRTAAQLFGQRAQITNSITLLASLIDFLFRPIKALQIRRKLNSCPDGKGEGKTHIFVDLIFGPRVTMALRLERAFREQQTITVLSIAQGHRQWTPGHQSNTDFAVHFRQIQFAFLATEHVIFGLLDNWRDAIELTAIGVSFHNL